MKYTYPKHAIINVLSIPKIVTLFKLRVRKNHYFPGEKHNFWEMVYCTKGSPEIWVKDKKCFLEEGDCVFHCPNEFHSVCGNQKNEAEVIIISFVCNNKSMNFFKGKIITIPQNLKLYFEMILKEFSLFFKGERGKLSESETINSVGSGQMVRTYLEQLLINLLRYEKIKEEKKSSQNEKITQMQMVSLVCNQLAQGVFMKISIEDVCKKTGYTHAYISKIFKEYTGKTMVEYYTFLKVEEGGKLLKETNYEVSKIAEILAYDEPNYFSKTFKKYTGKSPVMYRKEAEI